MENLAVEKRARTQCIFPNIVDYKIDNMIEIMSSSDTSTAKVKELSVQLLELSKPLTKQNSANMMSIAKVVFGWEEDLFNLRESLRNYYANKEDVCEIYLCKNNQMVSFIVVMDDSTSDSVFEYNEIGFELSEKYSEIEDFMIIDKEEAGGCEGLISNYDRIYKRG